MLRKYEKSLKLFLEALGRYGDATDFFDVVRGEDEGL